MSFQEYIPYLLWTLYISSSTLLHTPKSTRFQKSHKTWLLIQQCVVFLILLGWYEYSGPLVASETLREARVIWSQQIRETWLYVYNLIDLSDLYPQVLQKLGKTVETKDERFEQNANNFYHQQVIWRVGKGSLEEERRHEGWVAEE